MMGQFEPFKYKSADELLEKATEFGIDLPFQHSITPLLTPAQISGRTIPNRIVVQPMEGFDGNLNGTPAEWAFRRYKRYAEGGSGMIWFEATAVTLEGRSNPHQLMITQDTLDGMKQIVEHTRQSAIRVYGQSHDPYLVLQLTHSGRFSQPDGKPLRKTVFHNPYLEKQEISYTPFTDDELDRLKEIFIGAAGFAQEAGFDSVDVKACHGYLLHELLQARTRENSRYGGSFENRSRFIDDVVRAVSMEYPDLFISVRLNATDGIPNPYGFGMAEDGSVNVDLAEPKALIHRLVQSGCNLLNVTAGIPQHSPHIGRPFDRAAAGSPQPPEHPLEGVIRLIRLTGDIQLAFPEIPIVGTAYSWLRQFWPHVGAANVDAKLASFIGLGRGSFAYPEAPRDLMDKGKLDPRKCCITCSRCTELIRNLQPSGCVIRDREIYREIYKRISS